ncbi:MAG: LysM peptidoglycan-binding domain-containing protein [Anaerolineae bacterium]
MLRRLAMIAALLSVIGGLIPAQRAAAQDTSLLRDGGFEGQYTNRGRADLNIPTDWSIWIGESPHTEDWMNLPPVVFPHNGPDPAPHSGARSLNLNKGYATFTAAVYQQVSVPDGSNVMASAWAFLRTCKIPDGADTCTSSADSNAFTRIGIDPNGGTNPFDVDVVWGTNAAPHESWQQMTVSATATGGTATLFLYSTQQWPAEVNNVYWDDAALSVGGSGGVAASAPGAPTPPATAAAAPVVNAQGERSDGSIVHVVEAGDTLDSIAFAYGVTRADLLALNNIADPRIIQIGQEIIVKAAPTPTPTNTREGATEEPTPDPNATPEPPAYVRDAAPAPVISSASGGVVYPINPADSAPSICVILFEDDNQNRIQDSGEDELAGGEILLLASGTPVGQHTTESLPDPYCFDGLAARDYVVEAAPPSGYGLTTPNQLRVQAYAGAHIDVAFGAAQGVEPVEAPPADDGGIVSATNGDETDTRASSASPFSDNSGLIVFGAAGVVLVAGLGISLLLRRR